MLSWNPHKYQSHAIDFGVKRTYAGFFLDPGLGKTSISLSIVNTFKKRTLIVAPLRVCYQVWPREMAKWENFANIKYRILHGADREKDFLSDKVGVYLINPEGLQWLFSTIEKHKRFPFKSLIIDESTKFKAPKSKRFDKLKPYLKLFRNRYILTGTPLPNGYLDLWAQIYILDQGKALGSSFYAYRNKFFYKGDYMGWSWIIKPGAAEQIQELIKPFVLHISARDHLDLPDLLTIDRIFDLPKEVKIQYKTMAKKQYADVGEKLTAPNAAAAVNKCAQISNGFTYETIDEEQRELGIKPRTFNLHNEKAEIAADIVEELNGSPCLILYYYREDFLRLREKFPDAPYIGSGISGEEGSKIEAKWNRGEIPVLLCSMNSISHGLNLQEGPGHHIIFYALTYDFDVYDQCIRRIWRQGVVSNRVVVIRIIGKDTVDEIMCETVKEKEADQQKFLDRVKAHLSR